MRQQCSFFKSSTAFPTGVFVFQIQHCFCRSSVAFSNPCFCRSSIAFLKFNAAFAAAVFLSQIQHCFRPSSAAFSNPALQTRQEH